MSDELRETIENLDEGFQGFKASYDRRVKALEDQVRELETAAARLDFLPRRTGDDGLTPELRAAWGRWIRQGKEDSPTIWAAGSVGSDPEGGYLVAPEIRRGIEQKELDLSPIRRLARVERIGSDRLRVLIDKRGVGSGWVGEQSSRPETTTATIGEAQIAVREVYASPKNTQQLLDDTDFNVADWLERSIAEEFAAKEGTAFVTGDGVAKPRGFLTYATEATADATRAWGKLEHVITGDANGFIAPTVSASPADALITLVQKLRSPYRQDAAWVMNSATKAVVQKFKDVDGRFIWSPSLQAGQPSQLLGYPVVEAEDMPDVAAGKYPIAFANWKRAYTVVDHRVGIRILRDPFTAKPWVVFYSTKRVGGDVVSFEALKALKVSAT